MSNSEVAKYLEIFERRWLAALIVFCLGLAVIPFVLKVLPAYKASADILIVSQAPKDTTLSDPDLPSIITSTEVLGRVIDRLKLDTTPIALAKKVKTKLPAKSSILELTYRDTDPERAANVANTVADEAVTYFHDIATRGYSDVISALKAQISDSKRVIANADKRLQAASADNAFESSDKALDDMTAQIADLRAQRGQIVATLAADKATADSLQKQLSDIRPIVRGEILQKDVVYQTVQAEVGRDTADLVSERASFHDSFPGLAALRNRVDREKSQAADTATNAVANGAGESPSYTQTVLDSERAAGVVNSDEQRLAATDTELSDELNHLRDVAGAGAAVGTLRAERDAAQQQYVALAQRLSSAQGDAAQAVSLGTLVVVNRAMPGSSDAILFVAGMVVCLALLAIGAAFAFDVLDRRLWGAREVELVYGRPLLLDAARK